jgi:putative FmdB family regulatory protein
MHTYKYRCRTCGRHFEITNSDSDSEQDPECPYCQSKDVELNLSSLFGRVIKITLTHKAAAPAGNCGSPGPFN